MSEINEQISEKTFLIMRYLFSFVSIIPLIVFMILEIQITNIKNIQFSLHIQFLISCFIHAISFAFPPLKEEGTTCLTESFLNNCSIYSNLFLGSALIIIAIVDFSSPSLIGKHKVLLNISIFFISWIAPALLWVTMYLIDEILHDKTFYCWYTNEISINIDMIIKLYALVIDVCMVAYLERRIKTMFISQSSEESFCNKKKHLRKYYVFFFCFLCLLSTHFVSAYVNNIFTELIEDILECLVFLIVPFIFCFSIEKFKYFKNCMCCKQKKIKFK